MSSGRAGGVSLPKREAGGKSGGGGGGGAGALSRVTSSISQSPIVYQGKRVVSDASFVAKKLLKSTGKAAWIAGTTFIVLFVPLIIVMDRDQQMTDLEMQQASLLGAPPVTSGPQK